MNIIAPARLLKIALLVDAIGSACGAALQLVGGDALAELLGLPAPLLYQSGVFIALLVVVLVALGRSSRLWSGLVVLVVMVGLGWVLGGFALFALLPAAPTVLGTAFVGVHTAWALCFAALQWRGLRASVPAAQLRTVQP